MPSLFKTLGVVLCLAFALCFAAPNAAADEFVYTVTDNDTQFSFIEPTLASSGTVSSGPGLTQISGLAVAGFAWDSAEDGICLGIQLEGFACTLVVFEGNVFIGTPFPAGSFLAPGNFTASGQSVNIAAVATPEPGSLALMLSGVGLVFGMRKRWGLLQAS